MKKASFVRALVCVLAAATLLFALCACGEKQSGEQSKGRFYGIGDTGVTLNDDLTFVANLYHGVAKAGTYLEGTAPGDMVVVTFTVDGEQVFGTITGDVLTIPREWADSHGHGNSFPLQ